MEKYGIINGNVEIQEGEVTWYFKRIELDGSEKTYLGIEWIDRKDFTNIIKKGTSSQFLYWLKENVKKE